MPRHRIPIEQRFPLDCGDIRLNPESFHRSYQVDTQTGCWLWTAGRHRQGYGMFGAWNAQADCRMMVTAHRASWRIHRGDPGPLNIMHQCQQFHCVNPDHLALGTQSQTLSKAPRSRVGWPPGRPRRERRGVIMPRRQNWQYRFTDREIQFLRTATLEQLRACYPDWSSQHLAARRQRARTGYRWLPWPAGQEHLQPRSRSAKVVVDTENS